jgi:serine/threonine protein kinase
VQGYKISKPIGQGKFSIVYKAENEKGIPFALKKIKVIFKTNVDIRYG